MVDARRPDQGASRCAQGAPGVAKRGRASRYSRRPLPSSRYLPGRTPRPTQSPTPASQEATEEPLDPERWWENGVYLYAIDLYNAGYWWECHEELEGLWQTAGRRSPTGRLLQGLIQLSAANLKALLGQRGPARALWRKAAANLRPPHRVALGIDLPPLVDAAEDYFRGRCPEPPRIELQRRD